MGSLIDKLKYLEETKALIKNAIEAKGITIAESLSFRDYPDKIDSIKTDATLKEKLLQLLGVTDLDQDVLLLANTALFIKEDIKSAITEKGVNITSEDPYNVYPDKIRMITTSDEEPENYFDKDMLFCINVLKNRKIDSHPSKLLFYFYTNTEVTLKIGGSKGYIVETSDGQIYSSENLITETVITHTWKREKCPESHSNNGKIHWIIIYSKTSVIDQNIPECDFICLDNAQTSMNYFTEGTTIKTATALNEGRYLLDSEETAAKMATITFNYLDSLAVTFKNSVGFDFSKITYLSIVSNTNTYVYVGIPEKRYFIEKPPSYLSLCWEECTNGRYMFYDAQPEMNIVYLHVPNLAKKTGMFDGSTISKIPYFDSSKYTSMNSAFANCVNIRTIPYINTSSVTEMINLFVDCHELVSIPEIDTSNVLDMRYAFERCYKLQTVPKLDTSKVTKMNSMFDGCHILESVPLFNTSRVTDMGSMFRNCRKLKKVPEFDVSNVSDMRGMFIQAYELEQVHMVGISCDLDISASTKFTAEALVEIMNNLKTLPGKTLTMGTDNLSKLTDEQRAIATDKGWTLE